MYIPRRGLHLMPTFRKVIASVPEWHVVYQVLFPSDPPLGFHAVTTCRDLYLAGMSPAITLEAFLHIPKNQTVCEGPKNDRRQEREKKCHIKWRLLE